MGLTFSRSLRFGPVRFNFTGSGIGVSTGIRGLRIGTGPRGAYINAGTHGFRYRVNLGAQRRVAAPALPSQRTPALPGISPQEAANITSVHNHDTASVLELSDSDGDSLLASMNEQAKKFRFWPLVAAAFVLLAIFLGKAASPVPGWALFLYPIFAIVTTLIVNHRDQLKRLTVLFYEPDAQAISKFTDLVNSTAQGRRAQKLRSILQTSNYADKKRQAGASQGLKLEMAAITIGQAPGILANVEVPILKGSNTTLAFFPDRILAFQGDTVGAISYESISVQSVNTRFIETESLPGDATVIGQTWRYVNKSGGPDKRFNNNRQIPICRYNELLLSSNRGLDIQFLCSREDAFDPFVKAIKALDIAKAPSRQTASAA